MADMDYDREISPWGVREGCRKSERGKKRAREGSRHRLHRTLNLMWSLWLWASEMAGSCVNGYCRGGMVLIFRVLQI